MSATELRNQRDRVRVVRGWREVGERGRDNAEKKAKKLLVF